MTYLIVLAALALLPAIAIIVLSVNGAIAFMSLCLGSVLISYTSSDVTGVISSFSAKNHVLNTNQWVQLGLLVIPLILAILFTRKSVKGAKKYTNVLPALSTGLLFALLVTPLLSANLQAQIKHQSVWTQLSNAQTAVVLSGAAFSLLFILITHRTKHDDGDKKHSKH